MFASPDIQKIQLSRRRALALAGAAIAGPAIARAQASQEDIGVIAERNMQGAGFYRRKIGSFEVSIISDGTFSLAPPFPLFGANASEEQVKAALARDFVDYGHALAHVNALVVRTGKELVLIDTGCGGQFGPTTGQLHSRLANAGVDAKEIAVVVITHLHPDHIGGLLGSSGADAFPNAHYFLHADEKKFWFAPNPDFGKSGVPKEARGGMIDAANTVLKSIEKRVTLLDGASKKIVDGVDAVAAPGHTPGHITLQISDGGEQLLYITDAVHHHAIVMPNPDWYVGFDTDRDMAVKTRRAILDRAASDRLLVSGAHLPFPGFGHVRRNGNGFEFVPVVWEWT